MTTANVLKFIVILTIPFCIVACLDSGGDTFDPNAQFEADLKAIDNYIDEHNLDAKIDSASQIRYIIHKQGNDTTTEVGDTLRVHTEGFFLNGDKFYSSIDDGKPLKFILGGGQVIPGWEVTFSILEEKSEATIFIPSYYAYGRSGSRDGKVPSNTPLFFDVQFLDIINK